PEAGPPRRISRFGHAGGGWGVRARTPSTPGDRASVARGPATPWPLAPAACGCGRSLQVHHAPPELGSAPPSALPAVAVFRLRLRAGPAPQHPPPAHGCPQARFRLRLDFGRGGWLCGLGHPACPLPRPCGALCRRRGRGHLLSCAQDLLPELRAYWPDVIHSSNGSHFWRHEWDKHGTCAAQLDALNSEKKYFSKSLELFKALALNSVLQKLGIKPSVSYYQVADIKDALASVYGVEPKVQCLPAQQGEDAQTIGQIELCLTKDLHLRNCTEPGAPGPAGPAGTGLEVCEDGPVFYPPP
ncbi:Ribonuclease T2, partial [Galemys pyrenaicus]